ncbi:D-alanyl-D-alanine carboxypeptidase family protein [Microbacterium aurantiacum]|uniref:D-alanyl-D-alanine carboxypeptidase n=1 Tax=Microbacterium aurantiacum TaxID=162393 RepID=A0A0M9VM00_9MICO|nr:D-alanyl-D-alanine carboxypeptidase [Microbacterium chocolatum]ANG84368.1 D-alanyl-D-alanine carboxypeptidase [Microbacterium chocolatum]KOS11699.1 D-alanyl-D-alanine carboxypeptidase [Microbacterium chocolatum]
MSVDEAPATTRRARRETVASTTGPTPTGALAWLDPKRVTGASSRTDFATASAPFVPVEPDLLADAPRRSILRPGVLIPVGVFAALAGAYAATTLLWPLHAVAPEVAPVQVEPIASVAAAPAWPGGGSAAIAVEGIDGTLASSLDPASIASITKVVTALMILDELPLAPGEQGPEYRFRYADMLEYWDYRARGESALDVPIDGALTQYQMLEGILVGSANNYAERLASTIWPSDQVFASAARSWLATHGIPGITVVEPTGMDLGNTATAEALIPLAKKAMENPVVAEIVSKQAIELPGAGRVENTNGLLADPGVLGIKTGTLDAWNLLSAKDVVAGETTVRLYAAVLGQPDDAARVEASRALYAQLEQELQPRPSVTADTVAGLVRTEWGEEVSIVTASDAAVVLWNGGAGTVSIRYDLGDARTAGDVVGALSVDGPLDDDLVDLRLAEDIEPPSVWWRLTHPLELFDLAD